MATTVLTPRLTQTLSRAARRVRLRRALYHGATGLLAGLVLAAVLLFLLRAELLSLESPEAVLLLVPLFCAACGALWGASRPVSRLDIARLAEQRLGLKERFSTALLLNPDTAAKDPFAARQIADAEAHAAPDRMDLRTVVPLLPLPRRAWAALAAALALTLVWFLPAIPLFQSPAERAERAAVKKEGERLVRIAKALEREAGAKKLDATKKTAVKMAALGREMQRGQMPRKKALMKTAKLTEEIKQAQQALASQSSPQKSLAAAGRELEKALAAAQAGAKNPEGANKNLNAPQPGSNGKTPNSSPSQNTMSQSQKALAQNDSPSLAEQLTKLADLAERGEPKSAAERQQLSEQLGALGKALEGTSLSRASEPLKEAAEALKRGDNAEASRQLREAARRVAESGKQSEDARRMAEMSEALANGRSELADAQMTEGDIAEASEAQSDAFDKDGTLKQGHKHSSECTQPGGT